ncbi:hypothetical protein PIB30_066134 [Stylosanthes scabra]|uniref:Uncharacterized protein n=1 Tax=Stylosanthes scabra TaxID=79078 RepID=A0ABU6ZKZ7_9FABA|nr:hypothetical protein [Stylosanthes scabra]
MAEKEHFLATFTLLWEIPTKYNTNEVWYIEMILLDSKVRSLFVIMKSKCKSSSLSVVKGILNRKDNGKSQATEIDLVLTFSNKTRVTPVANSTFPLEALRLKFVADLLQEERIDDAELFGRSMFSVPAFQHSVIVVLHYFKATHRNGKTTMQNNFALSKVHINLELDEVVAFRESLLNGGVGSSSRISHVSSHSGVSAVE